MAGKSNYLSNALLNHVLGGSSFTRPATVYAALYITSPNAAGTGGTEVTGGSYARLALTNDASHFPAAASQVKTNGTLWDFGITTADWGDIHACAIWDALTLGNELYFGALTAHRIVLRGDHVKIAIGGAIFTES